MNHVIMHEDNAIELPNLIGIHGLAGTGKDTLAHFLHVTFGYARRAYADPLRAILNKRFGWTPAQWEDRGWKENGHWNNNCGAFTPRDWMQWLGTDILRKYAGHDIFVRLLFAGWDKRPHSMVVSDIRFNDEALAIIERGGVVIALHRDGITPVRAHVSESGIDERLVHAHLRNDGTISELCMNALALLQKLAGQEPQLPLDFGHP